MTEARKIMKSTKTAFIWAMLTVVAPSSFAAAPVAGAACGGNAIRLYAEPLAYEVVSGGKTLVPRTEIAFKLDGTDIASSAKFVSAKKRKLEGVVKSPVYKKSSVSMAGTETLADFGDFAVRLAARPDGVAYRFELKKGGTVNTEQACLTVPKDARCWFNRTSRRSIGCEETIPEAADAKDLKTTDRAFYLPFVYETSGKTVAVMESDVREYPVLNYGDVEATEGGMLMKPVYFRLPTTTKRDGRWIRVTGVEDCLVKAESARKLPWRVFIVADRPWKLCEADIVWALAEAPEKGVDWSWIKPGKVAWDWWNCFDNQGGRGCNTKTYERFIDFAAKNGVEYVILDEGWSERLNIWKCHPNVDVPHLIDYGKKKGVGIILWMAWAQVYGDEEKVASHFAKMGAKGFKVDFIDRGDAKAVRFEDRFAKACAKHKMLLDYHGAFRPVGLHRTYPNILNYEGIHGLEQMKWYRGDGRNMMWNDTMAFYVRLTAGPMDYTPGAMRNFPIAGGYDGRRAGNHPASVGTRCRQMAMISLYEAPLQMLCDSPTNYEKNMESFEYMAKVPTVWAATVGLEGHPEKVAAVARRAKDGTWYAAGITNAEARDYTLDTSFLGGGSWKMELFRDAEDSDRNASNFVHEKRSVKAGEKIQLRLAQGGGFTAHFTK